MTKPLADLKINDTDRVETFDMDGNIVHVFQGGRFRDETPDTIATLQAKGATHIRVTNRNKKMRYFTQISRYI